MNSFIKSLMEEKGLKQKDLAVILGVSPSALSQWNEEGTNITTENLFALSKLFHVTVDELLEGKRAGESLEVKWKREYDINDYAAKCALINGEKEKALKYFAALQKANTRFFELFEKKIIGRISENELKEWEYLKQFYDVDLRKSCFLNDMRVSRIDSITEMILSVLIDKIGTNNCKAIIWELQKVYHIMDYGVAITEELEIVPTDSRYDGYGDDPLEDLKEDEDIFIAAYNSMSPIEKDEFLTLKLKNRYRPEYIYKLIKCGGNILYTPSDLELTNYDYEDLEGLYGVKPVSELDKAHAVIYEIYDNYSRATYEQYQALINYPRMRRIEMEAKYKEKNAIKYWEYIKSNGILI